MTHARPNGARWAVIAALALVAPSAARTEPAAGGGAGGPAGTVAMSAATSAATPSKKDAYLASKSAAGAVGAAKAKALAARPGKPPSPVISVYNTHTNEWLVLDSDPRAPLPPPEEVDHFLRCHFTNQPTDMRPELIGILRDAARHFSARRIDIVSGYRSPKYNLMLRKKGHEVAKDSQHTQGHAVDFRIPGVAVRALDDWARSLRKGGVGLYLESGFVHVDVGPVRTWNGT